MLSHCDSTPSGDRSMTGYVAGLHLKEELLRLEKRQIIDGRKNTAHYRDRPGAGASVRRLFVIFFGFGHISQAVITDTKLHIGNKSITILL